jgi:hypothetical protein
MIDHDDTVGSGLREVGHKADGQPLALGHADRDVAAVVDVEARKPGRRSLHGRRDLVGDRACDGRHRRDEDGAVRPAGREHAAGDR